VSNHKTSPSQSRREVLQLEIYHQTLRGAFWGSLGAIAKAEELFKIERGLGQHFASRNARSLTYFAASSNARNNARAKGVTLLEKIRWSLRARSCLRRASKISDELEDVVGLAGMTPDYLVVRAAILRRVGDKKRALACIERALSHDLPPDLHVRVLSSKADILDELDQDEAALAAFAEAYKLTRLVSAKTLVRFVKARGLFYLRHQKKLPAKLDLLAALRLAEDHDLRDLVAEIKPLLDEITEYPEMTRSDFVFPLEEGTR